MTKSFEVTPKTRTYFRQVVAKRANRLKSRTPFRKGLAKGANPQKAPFLKVLTPKTRTYFRQVVAKSRTFFRSSFSARIGKKC
jgi:hypothetical protein